MVATDELWVQKSAIFLPVELPEPSCLGASSPGQDLAVTQLTDLSSSLDKAVLLASSSPSISAGIEGEEVPGRTLRCVKTFYILWLHPWASRWSF